MKYLLAILCLSILACGGKIPRSRYLSDGCYDYDSCKRACLYMNEKPACSVYLEIEQHYKANKIEENGVKQE